MHYTGNKCDNYFCPVARKIPCADFSMYEGWNFNSGNYLFTTDTK